MMQEIYVLEPRSASTSTAAARRYELRCSTVGKLVLGGGSEDFRSKYVASRTKDATTTAVSSSDARVKSVVLMESAPPQPTPRVPGLLPSGTSFVSADSGTKAPATKRKRNEPSASISSRSTAEDLGLKALPPLGSQLQLSVFSGSVHASMKPINHCIVMRHLPATVTAQAIASFFSDLKLLFDGCFFVVPSSPLPSEGGCPCPCCNGSGGASSSGDSRVDVYVHLCDGNSAALALKQDGESLQWRASGARSTAVNVSAVLQSVTLEELCWVYVTGVLWKPDGGSPNAGSAFEKLKELIQHESLYGQSLLCISKYWTDRGFKLSKYWKIIEQVVPFCREMHWDAMQTALLRGLKKRKSDKPGAYEGGSMSIDWISRKYASSDHWFSRMGGPDNESIDVINNTSFNRMLDADYMSKRMLMNSSFLLAEVASLRSKSVAKASASGSKSDSRNAPTAEDLVTVRTVEAHLTAQLALHLAKSCDISAVEADSSLTQSTELALDACDRMLSLFNLIEMWILSNL